ncbi:MAG: sugar phosphate nucleotidyltransferase [Thermodesulfobacteriota bacterium]
MNAMVLAAGLGTRLAPLTLRRPKCLMPVMNTPLLGWWLMRLAAWGVGRAVVNTHHLAGMIRAWLAANPTAGIEVVESHEPVILGTGGGLVAARETLGPGPFLLVNADVLAAADLRPLAEALSAAGAAAVLGLVDDARFNSVAVDAQGRVLGFRGRTLAAPPAAWRTYAGLAAIAPALLDHLPPTGQSSLVDGLDAAIAAGRPVLGLELTGFWDDLGTPQRLLLLHRQLVHAPPAGLEALAAPGAVVLGPGAVVEPGARIEGFCVLGERARVADGAWVKDSLLLPGAAATAGARVREAVLGDDYAARGDIDGGAFA